MPKRDIKDELISQLREQVNDLKKKLKHREGQLRSAEAAISAEMTKTEGMQKTLAAHFVSIHILANVVGNEKRADRDARSQARRSLERVNVRPPSTLGSSRPGTKKKTQRKKTKVRRSAVDKGSS